MMFRHYRTFQRCNAIDDEAGDSFVDDADDRLLLLLSIGVVVVVVDSRW